MSIYKLMQDPKAAEIYASLAEHIHPEIAADDYLQAKLAGNVSLCLALECYIRDLARLHFHRPEVLEALAAMERHKGLRKMGSSGSEGLKAIADDIEHRYAKRHYISLDDGRITFVIPTGEKRHFKITCKDRPGAVALVVAKYRRGMLKSRSGRYGTDTAIV